MRKTSLLTSMLLACLLGSTRGTHTQQTHNTHSQHTHTLVAQATPKKRTRQKKNAPISINQDASLIHIVDQITQRPSHPHGPKKMRDPSTNPHLGTFKCKFVSTALKIFNRLKLFVYVYTKRIFIHVPIHKNVATHTPQEVREKDEILVSVLRCLFGSVDCCSGQRRRYPSSSW